MIKRHIEHKVGTLLSRSAFFLILGATFGAHAESLSLAEALKEVRDHSPRIQKADSAAREASWKRVESYSSFLPTLSFSASYLLAKKYLLTDINLGGGAVS